MSWLKPATVWVSDDARFGVSQLTCLQTLAGASNGERRAAASAMRLQAVGETNLRIVSWLTDTELQTRGASPTTCDGVAVLRVLLPVGRDILQAQ